MKMKWMLWVVVMVAGCALAQDVRRIPDSTTFTRDVLTSTNAVDARAKLGLSSAGLVAHVGTVAEMQALNPTNYRIAIVHGYTARLDGGGGVFTPTNSVSGTNIHSRIVSTNNSAWAWARIAGTIYDALWTGGGTNSVGIGTTTPTGLLHVGNGTGTASVDPVVNVNRTLSSGSGNAHAFTDSSTVSRTGNIGYNSFDARITFDGSAPFDHYAGFQYAPVYDSSGLVGSLYGFYGLPSVSDGMVANNYGIYIANPAESGSGSVSNNWGIYVATQAAGVSNYAAAFLGKVGIGTATPEYSLQVVGANPRISVRDSGTNYALLKVENALYAAYIGQEGAAGGEILAGSTAGATVVTASGTDANLELGAAGVLRLTIRGADGGIAGGTNYVELSERTAAPAAPGANGARVYALDSGSGNTLLKFMFSDGIERTFASVSATGLTQSNVLWAGSAGNVDQDTDNTFRYDSSANVLYVNALNTGNGANELYAMDQNVRTSDAVTFATVNTGNGANELYAMNQNVRSSDSPTFAEVFAPSVTGSTVLNLTGGELRMSYTNAGVSIAKNIYMSPTAMLHIQGSAGAAGQAPLKLSTGTLLATPEAGAFEFNSGVLYFSPASARYKVGVTLTGSATLDFGSIAGAGAADLTITVTGAASGDPVALGLPTAPAAGIAFNAFVSAADTVTVRAMNYTAGSVDPPSATYEVAVHKE